VWRRVAVMQRRPVQGAAFPSLPQGAWIARRHGIHHGTPVHKYVHAYTIRMNRVQPPPFRAEPLGFFLTWTTYGSWLPGDHRGWTDRRGMQREPCAALRRGSERRMAGSEVWLDPRERLLVEETVRAHCGFRGWTLHAVRCLRQHVHVVVTVRECPPGVVLGRLKSRCTFVLRSTPAGRQGVRAHTSEPNRVWSRGGSMRRLYDERGLGNVITYVLECQG